jgi:hypothetical protein
VTTILETYSTTMLYASDLDVRRPSLSIRILLTGFFLVGGSLFLCIKAIIQAHPKDNTHHQTMVSLRLMAAVSADIVIVAAVSIGIHFLQRTMWWAGYNLENCPGCQPIVDWSVQNWTKLRLTPLSTNNINEMASSSFLVSFLPTR